MQNVLITGIGGSGGSYLSDYIVENNLGEVHGLLRWHSTSTERNLKNNKNKIHLYECDLTDFSNLYSTIRKILPDKIFHLASHANVRASWDSPISVNTNNITSTINLFEVVKILKKELDYNPRIIMISTSEVYGLVDSKYIPIKEDCPLNPGNPYAVSKLCQDKMAQVYHKGYNIDIIITRMFTYINPRREDLFATSFAKQIVDIERGLKDKLYHGNLDSLRTIIDVRDAMECYWIISEKGISGEIYNMGGETVKTVREFLDLLKNYAKCNIQCELDPRLLRPLDVTLQVPDITKFKNLTGWKAKYSFEDTIKFLLDYIRKG